MRGNVGSTLSYEQDLAVKMIKITDLNHECWNLTDTVQAAYGYLLDNDPKSDIFQETWSSGLMSVLKCLGEPRVRRKWPRLS